MTDTRSGFVAVVGRPNVGKSTLVNRLVGQKVSITSTRPQTTRNVIRGVLTVSDPPSQAVLVDTPGLHKPRTALGERLNKLVYGTLAEADVVLFVVDATASVGPGDRRVAERAAASATPTLCVVNKTDSADPASIAERLAEVAPFGFDAYLPVSAVTGDGVHLLRSHIVERLPPGPFFFPAEMVSDQPEHELIAEIVREKFLDRVRDEVPHSVAVVVEDVEQRDGGTMYIAARVIVERDSQKGIVIGRKGGMLAAAGAEARSELESIFGTTVYLDLRVAVEKDWQQRPQMLDRLGFHGGT